MPIRPVLALALLCAAPAFAQTEEKPTPSEAADAFQLDGLTPEAEATPTPTPDPVPSAEPTPAADTAAPTPEDAADNAPLPSDAGFSLDTLIADPRAKAVLDRDLPGLSDDKNLDKFKALNLRKFQPLTGGQLTDSMLVKIGADLGDPNAIAKAPVLPKSNSKLPEGR